MAIMRPVSGLDRHALRNRWQRLIRTVARMFGRLRLLLQKLKVGRMSFQQEGFLSPDMAKHISSIREAQAGWFELIQTLNRLSQKIILTQREIKSAHGFSDYRVVGLLYFTRATSSFQGATLLVERGMLVEANTLVRSLIETVWVLAGLTKDKQEFVKQLGSADYAERVAAGNWYMNTPSVTEHVSAENMEKMKAFIVKSQEGDVPLQKLILQNVASDTGLSELYAIYRHLSHHFAHPSLTAAAAFTVKGPSPEDKGIFWSPEYGLQSVGTTLGYMCTAMIGATLTINDIIVTDGVAAALSKAFDTYKHLVPEPGYDKSQDSLVPL